MKDKQLRSSVCLESWGTGYSYDWQGWLGFLAQRRRQYLSSMRTDSIEQRGWGRCVFIFLNRCEVMLDAGACSEIFPK